MRKFILPILLALWSAAIQGQIYFQQRVDYNIDVRLDDQNHMLHGYVEWEYQNNAPQSLEYLYVHLWPNAYQGRHTALGKQLYREGNVGFYFAKEKDLGFIDSLQFSSNGQSLALTPDPQHPDIAKIILPSPLRPGQKIKIATPFRVKIPSSSFSRLGHNKNSYQITQWYPKPAVYDANGWHPMPYLNQGEFYSEFGSFKVNITLPENYFVAATGYMQENPEEEARIAKRMEDTQQGNIPDSFPTSAAKFKTLAFSIDSVHDFAWFADKRFGITSSQVVLPRSGKTVRTYAYFIKKHQKTWDKATDYINRALLAYSEWVGDYPYGICTAVDGDLSAGGGMEYPTITVISPIDNPIGLDQVITHEVGHNWFYGILASNERMHPWMDEGLNSYIEARYMGKYYQGKALLSDNLPEVLTKSLKLNEFRIEELYAIMRHVVERNNSHQDLQLSSDQYTSANYGAMVYGKSSVIFNYLRQYLGDAEMDRAMNAYFEAWKFKHPMPDDFKQAMQKSTGKPLLWIFDELLSNRSYIDYGVVKGRKTSEGAQLKIKNKGQIVAPFPVTIFQNGKTETIWFEGFKGSQWIPLPKGDKYVINYERKMPEQNLKNNVYRSHSLAKTQPPLRLKWLTGLENHTHRPVYWSPIAGYNLHDGFMPGIYLSNLSIQRKKLEYILAPLYSFNRNDVSGYGQLSYSYRPVKGNIQYVQAGITGAQFGLSTERAYRRWMPYMEMKWFNREKPNKHFQYLQLRQVNTEVDVADIEVNPFPRKEQFHLLEYGYFRGGKIRKYLLHLSAEYHENFLKTWGSLQYKARYSAKKGYDIRLFGGFFPWKSNNFGEGVDARFRLSNWGGAQDYRFDQYFMGRNASSGFLTRQMSVQDGGFISNSFVGQSWDYLVSVNACVDLPFIPLPFKAFVNAANYYNAEPNRPQVIWETGLGYTIIKDVCSIYMPFFYSQNIGDALSLQNKAGIEHRLRITFELDKLAPRKVLRTL